MGRDLLLNKQKPPDCKRHVMQHVNVYRACPLKQKKIYLYVKLIVTHPFHRVPIFVSIKYLAPHAL